MVSTIFNTFAIFSVLTSIIDLDSENFQLFLLKAFSKFCFTCTWQSEMKGFFGLLCSVGKVCHILLHFLLSSTSPGKKMCDYFRLMKMQQGKL